MTVPAGGTGGPPPAGAAGGAAEVDTNPRRARPEDTPMTLFLMEIGRQHPARGRDRHRRHDVNTAQCVEEALRLGDIHQIGTTPIIPAHPVEKDSDDSETEESDDESDTEGKAEPAAGAGASGGGEAAASAVEMIPASGGYPIYEFFGPETGTFGEVLLKFSADPRYGDIVGPSMPPSIPHHPGEIHSDMEAALWGGYCYAHPTGRSRDDYDALFRGMHLRYGGDNHPPR